MGSRIGEIEAYLCVGTAGYLHVYPDRPSGQRLRVVIRGWQPGGFVLVEPAPGESKPPASVGGVPAILRLMHEGMICGFGTAITAVRGSGAIYLAWPYEGECVRVRSEDRLPTSIPCVAVDGGGTAHECLICDLSPCGCCLRLEVASPPWTPQDPVTLRFVLPDGFPVEGARATVRNVRPGKGAWLTGCRFQELDGVARHQIAFFVMSTFDRMRGGPPPAARVLLLEVREAVVAEIGELLRPAGVEVVAAPGVVDACYRLRMGSPCAMLVSGEHAEMDPADLCRLILNTRGFEHLPVIVYGGNDDVLGRRVSDAGAIGYVRHAEMLDEMLPLMQGYVPALQELV